MILSPLLQRITLEMNIRELVWLVVEAILNAATFDLLVNKLITYIVNLPLPWATGVLAVLLTQNVWAVYHFSDHIFPITMEKLLTGLATLFKYLLPWIGIKYLLPWIVLFSGFWSHLASGNPNLVVFKGDLCKDIVIQVNDQRYLITKDCSELWPPVVYLCRLVIIYRFFLICRRRYNNTGDA